MSLYPADLLPRPVRARSTARLSAIYNGTAMVVSNASAALATIPFIGDALDTAALDAHIGSGGFGRVTQWNDQISGGNATSTVVPVDGGAPKIKTRALGGHRALVFEGGGRSDDLAPPPELTHLDAAVSGSVAANVYTYMAVIWPTAAGHFNQASGPSAGTLLAATGAASADVLQISNDGGAPGAFVGRWKITDGGAFTFTDTDSVVSTSPGVLTVTSGPSGTRVWWDEDIIATSSRSALSTVATNEFLGKLATSVVGGSSMAFDGWLCADMLWSVELSPAEACARRTMLYEIFGLNPSRSLYNARTVIVVGDSNGAQYKSLGRMGMTRLLQASLPSVRFHNYAVEGSTITLNPADPFGASSPGYTIGLMDYGPKRALQKAKGDVALIIDSNGNDHGIIPLPTPTDVFNGYLTIKTKMLAANPNAKLFIITGTVHNSGSYESWQQSLATLIRNGAVANGYTAIDSMADARLQGYFPQPWLADGSHRSEYGHSVVAELALTALKNKFGWT